MMNKRVATEARVAVIATLRQANDLTRYFVDHHRRIGITDFLLYFDDPAYQDTEAFAGEDDVHVIWCDDAYWRRQKGTRPSNAEARQWANIDHGVEFCRSHDIRYMTNIDGDELIHSQRTIGPAIADEMGNDPALLLETLEAFFTPHTVSDDGAFTAVHFLRQPNRINRYVARVALANTWRLSRSGFFGHYEGKYIVDIRQWKGGQGVHRPITDTPPRWARAIHLLHFNCMNYVTWRDKWSWRKENPGLFINDGGPRMPYRRQRDRIFEALSQGETSLRALYRALHVRGGLTVALLRASGLARKIDLRQKMPMDRD
jgi:hypothetical protein